MPGEGAGVVVGRRREHDQLGRETAPMVPTKKARGYQRGN